MTQTHAVPHMERDLRFYPYTNMDPQHLTPAQITQFNEKGYVFPVTVWLAIDDVDDNNGPMLFIPGSHLHGQIPFDKSTAEDNNVLNQSVRDPENWGDAPAAETIRAGQVSLHTDLLLHGSEPNRSQRQRCGLTLRCHPPDVRRVEPEHAPGIICRGSDPSGYWQPIERPEGDSVPDKG